MRFFCNFAIGKGILLTTAINPITKTEVVFTPSLVMESTDQLEVFAANFELYCQVIWHFSRSDPVEIDATRWPTSPPPWLSNRPDDSDTQVISEPATTQPGSQQRPRTQQ